MKDREPIRQTEITTLAASIRQEHEQVRQAITAGLQHAREAGRLLAEARRHVQHGGWIRFVEQQCGLSRSTAAGYIRICERWAEIENVQRVAHLPLRKALALLAEPKPSAKPAAPTIQAGVRMRAQHDDGRIAYIHPSADPAFVFYNVFSEDVSIVDGGKRAIAREYVMLALEQLGFPVTDVTWESTSTAQPWTFNEFLYSDHDDYMQHGVLGGDGFIDNPAVLTSPEEHRANVERNMRSAR
jgi:hypothetical protein